jgi:hypothetical protein
MEIFSLQARKEEPSSVRAGTAARQVVDLSKD